MKTILKPILTIVLSFAILSCSTAQKITENNAPFKVQKASFYKWFGGQPGAKGFVVTIIKDTPDIKLDSISFKGMNIAFEPMQKGNNTTFRANFVIRSEKHRIKMIGESAQEYGNQVPDITTKDKEIAESNDAIISYFYKKKKYYLKIKNLKETKQVMYY